MLMFFQERDLQCQRERCHETGRDDSSKRHSIRLTEKSVRACDEQCFQTTKSPLREIYESCDKKNCASSLKRIARYQTFLRTTSLVHTAKSPSPENYKYYGSMPEDSKVNGRRAEKQKSASRPVFRVRSWFRFLVNDKPFLRGITLLFRFCVFVLGTPQNTLF